MEKPSKDIDNEQQENISPDGTEAVGTECEPSATAEQDSSADSQAESATAAEIEKLQLQIAEKDKELADLKDKYLRSLADSENARKRIRQQSEDTVRLERERLLRELLPIVDNLERAVDAASGGGNGKSIVEGVDLVLRGLLDFLKSHGVTQISSVGQPFDPQRHEAVDQIETDAHPPNTVVNELHRGYLIGDRMLRPARVTVAKTARESGNGNGTHGNGADGGEVETS